MEKEIKPSTSNTDILLISIAFPLAMISALAIVPYQFARYLFFVSPILLIGFSVITANRRYYLSFGTVRRNDLYLKYIIISIFTIIIYIVLFFAFILTFLSDIRIIW